MTSSLIHLVRILCGVYWYTKSRDEQTWFYCCCLPRRRGSGEEQTKILDSVENVGFYPSLPIFVMAMEGVIEKREVAHLPNQHFCIKESLFCSHLALVFVSTWKVHMGVVCYQGVENAYKTHHTCIFIHFH